MLSLPSVIELLAKVQPSTILDLSDRLNFGASVYLIALFALITGSKQHFGTPIQCMTPAESPDSWISYYQDYCYIENKLKVDSLDRFNSDIPRTEKLVYYQWIPYVLFIQSLSFLIPKLFWSVLSSSCGNAYEMEVAISEVGKIRSLRGDKRSEAVKEAAIFINDVLADQGKICLGRHRASLIFTVMKWLCVLNVALQLEMLTWFIGDGDRRWGIDLVATVISGKNNPENGAFPRVVMCDVTRLELGAIQNNLMQCVLMMNYVNEKVFAFIWLWLVFVLLVTFISALVRTLLTIIPPLRKWNLLTLLPMRDLFFERSGDKVIRKHQERVLSSFIYKKLSGDGVLMVTYMREHAGALLTGEILRELFELSRPKKKAIEAVQPIRELEAEPVQNKHKKIRAPPKHELSDRIESLWPSSSQAAPLLAHPRPRARSLSYGDVTNAVAPKVPSYTTATTILASRQSINRSGTLSRLDGNMKNNTSVEENTSDV